MARQAKRPAAAAPAAPTDFFIGRERLFVRLDHLSGRAVWLQGPTGAGKTVLLRTYVRRSAAPVLWLAIDAKSTTPDALFNALAQAAHRAGVEDLPQFAGEHRQAPNEFMRLSAERIVQRLPGAIVVIDDAQRLLPALAPLLQVLIDACCVDLRLLFAGQDLPLGLEPQIAASKLVVIGHEQLAFDETEANELAKRVGASEALAHAMRERTSGWAAGLMLALQLGQGSTPTKAQRRLEGPLASLVHGGVLTGVAPETVHALAALAPARYIPITLPRLGAPWTEAVTELERLSERGLFVERQENGDLRLHDLFCSALRQEPIDDEDRDAAVAALTLVQRCELALSCIVSVPDCGPRLEAWLTHHGDTLLMRADVGSLAEQTLQRCSDLTPAPLLWCARGAMATDLTLADLTAERAFEGFKASDDPTGCRRCCGVGLLVQSVLLNGKRLDVWQKRLAEVPMATEQEFSLYPLLEGSARLLEHILQPRRPNSPEIYSVHTSLHAVLLGQQPPQEAILAASVAVGALLQLQRREAVLATLAQLEDADWFRSVPPFTEIEWHINKGFALIGLGRGEEASASFAIAADRAKLQGMKSLQRSALAGAARAQLTIGALDEAEDTLAQVAACAEPGIPRRVHELCLVAWLELTRGRSMRSLSAIETAEQLLAESGAPMTGHLERAKVHVLYATGQTDAALLFAERCGSSTQGAQRDLSECDRQLLISLSLWSDDRAAALRSLCDGLALVVKHRWTNYLLLLPVEAGIIACRALHAANAVEVVKDSIRERRLPAPGEAGAEWPWPLRVYVLGHSRLERFDEPMHFRGKVQRKPLELLKYLACARDQAADHATVCEALWPDADTSAARRNLEMATARLREMLGNPAWVRVTEGRTRLERQFVWSDAQAFWRACTQAERAAAGTEATSLREAGDAMLRLYSGALLPGEEETPWLLGARERLRAALIRSVRAVADSLCKQGASELASALLARAYSSEPLAEGLAQQLIRLQLESGQAADAMTTYRHLRQMLSVLLGAQPSTDSERLRQSILTQLQERSHHD